jgi:hypothetical protein
MEPNSTLVHFYMKNIGKHEEKISGPVRQAVFFGL